MKKIPLVLPFIVLFIISQIIPSPVLGFGTATGATGISLEQNNFLGQNSLSSSNLITTVSPLPEGNTETTVTATITVCQPALTFTGKTALDAGDDHNIAIIDKNTHTGFIASSNYFSLDNGNILISPEKNIVIGTRQGLVSIESGAAIFLMESGTDIVIYDLYQSKAKQVSVVVNKHKLVMEPGRMLVLTIEKAQNFCDLDANHHFIKYRRAQAIDLQEDKINAYEADFSIFSALVRIEPLKQLIDSKDKHDQLLLQKLLKSAAMLRV